MRLTVDDATDEVKQFAPDVEWLGNSYAYVGGTATGRPHVPNYVYNFRGCMKKVRHLQ